MPKNIEDIILPERRRSIRNIPIPEGRRKMDTRQTKGSSVASKVTQFDNLKKSSAAPVVDEDYGSSQSPQRTIIPRNRRSRRKRLWFAVSIATIILFFAILSLFNSATLAYVPKSAALTFDNENYTAEKTGEDKLLYSVVKLSGEKGQAVSVSGEAPVSRKASGTIVIYNNASVEVQKLVLNTRFESPSGKIYRILHDITIPGKKMVSGVSTPGTVEVTVYADVAGETYNTGLTDFTVPGLKGTPRYSTIYARSKTAMVGGFVGQEKVVSPEDLTKAKGELQVSLTEELTAKAKAEVPPDFILFPSLSSVTFEDMPQTAGENVKSANVNLRGHLYGIMFKRSDLAHALALKKTTLAKDDQIDILSYDDLKIAFTGTAPADLLSANEIIFNVSGNALVLWRTDEVALKSDLAGRSKREIPSILKNYPTIATVSATVRPFWKSAFPENSDKIFIKKLKVE